MQLLSEAERATIRSFAPFILGVVIIAGTWLHLYVSSVDEEISQAYQFGFKEGRASVFEDMASGQVFHDLPDAKEVTPAARAEAEKMMESARQMRSKTEPK